MKRQIQDYHRESVLSSLSIPSNESMMKNFQTKKSRLFQNKKKKKSCLMFLGHPKN